ncbi:MAG: S-methyl-5'-thioinosine phosphorylase, partial [Gammaproteobacteria bacterium]
MRLVIIGGTGALSLVPAGSRTDDGVQTPFGSPSAPFMHWRQGEHELYFLARHGMEAAIAPHRVNYRANIWAVHELAPDAVLGVNAVGGIHPAAAPGELLLPDQLIDYTWGREHTFETGSARPVRHLEFTRPFDGPFRTELIQAAEQGAVTGLLTGCYGATQGPRLETAAEIDRLERDCCAVVGMTAMPEASLARELELDYAVCAVVVNYAAGRHPTSAGIHAQIEQSIAAGMARVEQLLDT